LSILVIDTARPFFLKMPSLSATAMATAEAFGLAASFTDTAFPSPDDEPVEPEPQPVRENAARVTSAAPPTTCAVAVRWPMA
jgi:hypothetical protein